jgi:isoleucyl-tRNA synthetase
LESDEYDLEYVAKGQYSVESDNYMIVALDTVIDDDLKYEGIARDFVRYIQDMRKEADYKVDDRIAIKYQTESSDSIFKKAIDSFKEYVMKETLADDLSPGAFEGEDINKVVKIEQSKVTIALKNI